MQLQDAYLSVVEALKHGAIHHGTHLEIDWVDAETLGPDEAAAQLRGVDGILIPGGFGPRAIEGKVAAVRYARESGTPFLGICLGMQCAVVEFARNVCDMHGANSTEFDPDTLYPVVALLPEQQDIEDMGGTMRLGAEPVELRNGTHAHDAYGETLVYERHRHRYEVNNHLRPRLEAAGLRVSGVFAAKDLVEVIELDDHPWFVRLAVPPRVQVAPDAAASALPRLRRRGASACRRGASARHDARRSRPTAPSACSSSWRRSRARRGSERAVTDRCIAYLRDLGLEPHEEAPPLPGRRGGQRDLPHPGDGGRGGHADPALRARRHRRADGADRAGRGRRRRHERARHDPRRRQQGRGGRDARGRAPHRRESRPHAGIELVLSVQEETGLHGVKALDCSQLEARIGYVYDHAAPIGGLVDGLPVAVLDRRDVPRPLGARGHRARRRAATRSPRRRTRWPRCASAGSTTRRRPTSARSPAASRATSWPTAAMCGSRCARATTSARSRRAR